MTRTLSATFGEYAATDTAGESSTTIFQLSVENSTLSDSSAYSDRIRKFASIVNEFLTEKMLAMAEPQKPRDDNIDADALLCEDEED